MVIVCHSLPIQLNLIIRVSSTFMMMVVSVCISQVFSHDWSRCHQCYRGYQSNSCHKCYFPIIIFIHISAGYYFYLQSYKQNIQMLANDTVSLTSSGSSSKSGYVPFMGNAIELINTGSGKNKNFTAKYSKCCRHTRKNGQQSLKPCLSSYFTPSNITNSGK